MSAHAWKRRRDKTGVIKELVALRMIYRRDPAGADAIIESACAEYLNQADTVETRMAAQITKGLYAPFILDMT